MVEHADMETDIRGREASENFPVALRLLPRAYRDDLHAVYAFARVVDEAGDSLDGERLVRLAELGDDLDRIWDSGTPTDPVIRRLVPTVRRRAMTDAPFHRLIAANVQDQSQSRYPTFDDLRGYCRLSAEPVGRMVLQIFGQADSEFVRSRSDDVCAALQLLEHWQDVGEDRRAGRVYVPQEDLLAYDVSETDLDATVASDRLCTLMRFEIDRAERLLEQGTVIVSLLRGWARVCVAGYVAGGRATVEALRRTGGDVLGQDTTPSRLAIAGHLLGLLVEPRPGVRR